MSDSGRIEEEHYQIAKSSMTLYLCSSLCFEYILAQNQNKNPKGLKFLLELEKIARISVKTLGIPESPDDVKLLNENFKEKIISGIKDGSL